MKRWHWISLAAVMGGSLILERTALHDLSQTSYWWDHIPGFYGWFGFLGCIGIILASKLLGRKWLQKDEHYYDGD
jgi:hypothetical protein